MEHPPPLPFSAPPLTAAQIAILTTPPPPFPDSSRSVDLSPLEFLLALIAIVTIPALIYTFIFAFGFSFCRRRPEQNSGELSFASDDLTNGGGASVSDFKYRKDAHVKETGGDCPVCLSVFVDGEKLRELSCCKHYFHADCIDLWLGNRSSCPICRATVAGKRRNMSAAAAPVRDNDLMQGLPDASTLV
ncbi:putative transcription factor C2H2 family [Medicago truncatula]|uniref:C3HC4-type RING zinc finger protein n=1 Tax=Medicago truncatula TaxID=3880 RepID=G7JUJ7_MEDTR|nr:RING-H2 finger protein ATL33 [Medicago truncatula]AES87171.1 C3HC4-type RING zinc finger protein [Medicago truncatula]RHN59153.1 putative transcription factor C2H2 family [Medicago truncatula]